MFCLHYKNFHQRPNDHNQCLYPNSLYIIVHGTSHHAGCFDIEDTSIFEEPEVARLRARAKTRCGFHGS
jgi:hypothetical protein